MFVAMFLDRDLAEKKKILDLMTNFDVSLTVHLSIFILVINQLEAQIFFLQ